MTVLRLEIPEKMMPFAQVKRRHKIARGGRGSGKSWSIARLLALKGYLRPTRWLCCRESQASIKESSLRLLADQINAMGLGSHYEIQSNAIYGRNGTEFAFIGLREHTADNVKSYEAFDGAWIAEAQSISSLSAEKLVPTIRKPGSELWWDYNPDEEDAYVHQMAEHPDEDTLVCTLNYSDNKWFPVELEKERLKLLRLNADLYQHVWEGKCRTAAGILFKREWFQWYDVPPSAMNIYLASDYAGGRDLSNPHSEPDFTEHGVFGSSATGGLYILDWWYGQEDPATWIDAWIELCAKHEPLAAFEEKGPILRAVDGAINRRMQETGTYVRRIALPSGSGKIERALGFAARASAGSVYLPRNQPWAMRLLNQLCSFTGKDGRKDDGVDVCSLIGRGLNDIDEATIDDLVSEQRRDADYDTDNGDEDSWKTT